MEISMMLMLKTGRCHWLDAGAGEADAGRPWALECGSISADQPSLAAGAA